MCDCCRFGLVSTQRSDRKTLSKVCFSKIFAVSWSQRSLSTFGKAFLKRISSINPTSFLWKVNDFFTEAYFRF